MLPRFLIPLLLLLIPAPGMVADFSTPTARVRDSIDRVITILKNESLHREDKWKRIAEVIDEGFDFRSMSQSVLSTNWKKATVEERERFTEFFSQYIEEIYRTRIETYTDQQVVYENESIRGKRAVVDTMIVTASNQVPVTFKLKNNNGDWYAYDVVIEGVSLVANYRETFSAIVKNEGMDGLIADLQRRIDNHKARQTLEESKASGN